MNVEIPKNDPHRHPDRTKPPVLTFRRKSSSEKVD